MTTARTLPRPAGDPAAAVAVVPTAAILVVGLRTGRLLLADPRTVREVTGDGLPVRSDDRAELVRRTAAAVRAALPPGVPLVVAGHPRAVDRLAADGSLLDLVAATVPGHHEHTSPAILRSHALRVLRRRPPVDHHVGRR